jgi:hypothetical protein
MTSNPPPTDTNHNRLYSRFIKILKIIQYLGYSLVAIYVVFFVGLLTLTPAPGFNVIGLVFALLWALIGFIFVYVTTQSVIAIVDLLSRIERNTRKSEE